MIKNVFFPGQSDPSYPWAPTGFFGRGAANFGREEQTEKFLRDYVSAF
jgi:hypothetical protein